MLFNPNHYSYFLVQLDELLSNHECLITLVNLRMNVYSSICDLPDVINC